MVHEVAAGLFGFSLVSLFGGLPVGGSTWGRSGAPALKHGCRFRFPTRRSKCRPTFWRLSNDPLERFLAYQKAH